MGNFIKQFFDIKFWKFILVGILNTPAEHCPVVCRTEHTDERNCNSVGKSVAYCNIECKFNDWFPALVLVFECEVFVEKIA